MSPILTPSRRINWQLLLVVFGFVFGSGVFFKVIELVNQGQAPKFAVSAINTLTGNNVYEITNHLLWYKEIPSSTLSLDLGLEVRPTYSGESLGEVQVLAKNRAGKVVARDSWKSLNKDSRPLQLILDSHILDSVVDAQRAPYQEDKGNYVYPSADLTVEVSKVSDPSHPLYTDTLKVLNTPWYHFSRAVPDFLNGDIQSVDFFVKGRNLGDSSEFVILTEIYEITDTAGGPFNPWPKLNSNFEEVGKVERNTEFAIHITVPSNQFKFERGKCYAVKTFAIKKQNYAEFPSDVWSNSSEAWRFGDWEDLGLVCSPNLTPTVTATPTSTPTPTATSTPSPTSTPTPSSTPCCTPINTPTLSTPILTPTHTKSPIPITPPPSRTPTPTPECIYHTSEGKGGTVSITLSPPLRVREIIISMTQKSSSDPTYGYSLYEVEAYGADTATNLVTGGTAHASTTQQTFTATNAIDGNREDPSRWSSDPRATGPQHITITLPSAQFVNRIVLYWELAYSVEYDVCVIHD